MKKDLSEKLPVIGWREWVKLPDLGIGHIKAKIDTGARSSSLHAFDVETFRRCGMRFVRFKIHPIQRSFKETIEAEAEILDFRKIRSSSGEVDERPVIVTTVSMLNEKWPIELTLANRDQMGFRMLLGREAVRRRMLIDPGESYCTGLPKPRIKTATKKRATGKRKMKKKHSRKKRT